MSNAERCRRYRIRAHVADHVANMSAQISEMKEILEKHVATMSAIMSQIMSRLPPPNGFLPDLPSLTPSASPKGDASPPLVLPQPVKRNVGRKPKPLLADWQPSERHYRLAEAHGCDAAWTTDQAERYRDWLANAKQRHTDFDAGFNNWLKRSLDEHRPPRTQINGHHHKPTARDNLFLGAALAAEAWEERQRNRGEADEPFLDGQ